LLVSLLVAFALGVEIAGAWFVVRGLLSDVGDVAAETWNQEKAIVAGLRDRLDGLYGLSGLVFGFGLQLVSLAIAQATEGPSDRMSLVDGVSVIATGVVGAAALYSFRLAFGDRTMKAWLIRISKIGSPDGWPYLGRLLKLGQAARFEIAPDETPHDYLRRTFRVVDVIDGDPPYQGIVMHKRRRWYRLR
jgi:hypothetical protein